MFKSNLAGHVDAAYRASSFGEIAEASPGALIGLSYAAAAKVMEALGVRTIEELATSKHVLWAQSITHLAKYETSNGMADPVFGPGLKSIFETGWERKPLREVAKASPSILAGISKPQAALLAEALNVYTVEDLATNRIVLLAQVITHLAKHEKVPEPVKQAA